jgi:hypothetical protein
VAEVKQWERVLRFALSQGGSVFDFEAYNQVVVAFSQCLEMLDRPSISPDFESLYAKAKAECVKLLGGCM